MNIILRMALLGPACSRWAIDIPSSLTNAGQVLAFASEKASESQPVGIRGVVTYAETALGLAYVQEGTAGVMVRIASLEITAN